VVHNEQKEGIVEVGDEGENDRQSLLTTRPHVFALE